MIRRCPQLDAARPARPEPKCGSPDGHKEIMRVAHETGSDLIVLGTHGRGGIGRLVLGSVAEHVVRSAPCPVLTVKAPPPDPSVAS